MRCFLWLLFRSLLRAGEGRVASQTGTYAAQPQFATRHALYPPEYPYQSCSTYSTRRKGNRSSTASVFSPALSNSRSQRSFSIGSPCHVSG